MKQGKKRNWLTFNRNAELYKSTFLVFRQVTESIEVHDKIGDRLTNNPSYFSIAKDKHYLLDNDQAYHRVLEA